MTQLKKRVKVQKSLNDTLTCRWCDAGVCRERWWCSVALVSLGARLADSSYRKCQRGSPTTGSSPTTFHGNHAHLHNTLKKTQDKVERNPVSRLVAECQEFRWISAHPLAIVLSKNNIWCCIKLTCSMLSGGFLAILINVCIFPVMLNKWCINQGVVFILCIIQIIG